MAHIDPARTADTPEFQIIDCVDDAPALDTGMNFAMSTAPARRYVSSQDLPRFSRTSLQ